MYNRIERPRQLLQSALLVDPVEQPVVQEGDIQQEGIFPHHIAELLHAIDVNSKSRHTI